MTQHACQKEEIIEAIRSRLGDGDVSLATIKLQLDQILAQTTKTNGRVSKLERFSLAIRWALAGGAGFFVVDAVGLREAIVRLVLK